MLKYVYRLAKLSPCYFNFVFVEHVFKMKILQDWNDELKDKESTAFKALSARLETQVKTINVFHPLHFDCLDKATVIHA